MKNQKVKIRYEVSAGCVVYRRRNQLQFALGQHSGYHKWVLPKGLVEKGENKTTTAIRETKEELGLKVKVVENKPIHKAKYTYRADFKGKVENSRRVDKYAEAGGQHALVKKTVYFFLAEYVAGDIDKHGWEMEKAGWFNFKTAYGLLAFKDEKEALKKAAEGTGVEPVRDCSH